MNERYIFRGRRVDNGEWMEGSLLPLTETRYAITDECPVNPYGGASADKEFHAGRMSVTIYEVDPATVGQCTGLRDRNGRLIFEGDRVHIAELYSEAQAYWNHGAWLANFDDSIDCLYDVNSICEVVGTIHDGKKEG